MIVSSGIHRIRKVRGRIGHSQSFWSDGGPLSVEQRWGWLVFHVIDIHKTPGSGSSSMRKMEIFVTREVAGVWGLVVGEMKRRRGIMIVIIVIVMMKRVGKGGVIVIVIFIRAQVEVGI